MSLSAVFHCSNFVFIILFSSVTVFQFLSIVSGQNASEAPLWSFVGHNRTSIGRPPIVGHRRKNVAITIGQYSEREGDRDMLEKAKVSLKPEQSVKSSSQTIVGRWEIGHEQSTLPRPVRPIFFGQSLPQISAAADSTRALARYDTALPRFTPKKSSANRIILPPGFVEGIRNGVAMDSLTNHRQRPMDESMLMPKKSDNYEGNGAEKPKTVILTNGRVPPPPEDQIQQTSGSRTLPEDGQVLVEQGNKSKYRKPVPLSEHRHEDIRPATDGQRLGPQAKYAGQTNEYKEDLGKEFTRRDGRRGEGAAAYFGPLKYNGGDGPASRLAGSGINPPPEGTRIRVEIGGNQSAGEEAIAQGKGRQGQGQISPNVNAPEEITGSRFRNIDEQLNALNGGNRGRGPNRYVKMDLLNE
uniref:Uncharacterized protein n=1 Tax=Globodera rostochiensis TaxID=31243 RepID=A0A914HCD5_GLORO